MATTMKDVARRAGVDVSTVSLAINNDPRIRAETRERIVGIAHELGYQKNFLARGLRSGRSFTIGMAVGGATAFWSEVLAGAQSVLAQHDYHLLLDYAADSEQHGGQYGGQRGEHAQIESLTAKRVDGLLIAPSDALFRVSRGGLETEAAAFGAYRALREANTPFVFVDRFVPGIEADSVSADNVAASRLATDYLIGKGHRSIAYLYAPHRMSTAQQERRDGYHAAMDAAGLTPLLWTPTRCGADRSVEGKEAVCVRLDKPETRPVTAILAATDSTALGALRALDVAQCPVPERFSVVAIGGSPLMDYLRPPVTTVTLPMRELGIEAANLLLARIAGDISPYQNRRLAVELVERGSCGDMIL